MANSSDGSPGAASGISMEIRTVLVAGSIGGFASWLYGIVVGEPVPGGFWGIFIAIFLGAFAAGIGVYVLTNTDTSAYARTLFFAALCGFAWKPVCDAGQAFIEQSIQQSQDEEAQDNANDLIALSSSLSEDGLSGQELAFRLEKINSLAQVTVDSISNVTDRKVRADIEAKVNASIESVSAVAPKNPVAVSRVLEDVGGKAAQKQQIDIAARSLVALDTLEETSIPENKQQYSGSRQRLENEAKRAVSPRIRRAATTTSGQL